MKSIILKSVFFSILSAGLFTSCVKDEFGTPTLGDCSETSLVKNREVSQISAGAVVALHTSIVPGVSDVIEAYVTSSDIGGNFFKSISFQTLDGSKAFSVPVDATSTFINYEPGRKVLIKMDGLYKDVKYDGMRIGGLYANSSGGAEVGRMTETDFKASVNRTCTAVNENQLVQQVTIAQAISGGTYLNKLIEFDRVEFVDNDINNTTYYDPSPSNPNTIGGATNRRIQDFNGNSVIFRTSGYANFAAKPVASGSGKIRGIMTKYNTDYQFMVRSENDIKLTGARFTPLLNETFDGGIAAWTAFSVTGAEVWVHSTTFGNPGSMAKMSGFATANRANEDWLISPVQNLSALSTATLSFDNAYKFAGDPIVVLVSKNYSGSGSPYAAGVTWTTITGATLSAGNYVYANSGNLSLNSFVGTGNNTVYVAFKYTSSTAAASTWEIDNVKITGN
jgi:hypothetical protein